MDALLLLVVLASAGQADPGPDVWGVGPPGPLVQRREDVWCHAAPDAGPAVPPPVAPPGATPGYQSVLPHGVIGALRSHPTARVPPRHGDRVVVEATAEAPAAPDRLIPSPAPPPAREHTWPPAYAPGPPG